MMNEAIEKKVTNLLGIAQRANKIVSGELAVERFVQSGKAKLLIVAGDASAGTKKKYTDMAKFYQIDLLILLSKQTLGECIGKSYRAAIALGDSGFIKALSKLINTGNRI